MHDLFHDIPQKRRGGQRIYDKNMFYILYLTPAFQDI